MYKNRVKMSEENIQIEISIIKLNIKRGVDHSEEF